MFSTNENYDKNESRCLRKYFAFFFFCNFVFFYVGASNTFFKSDWPDAPFPLVVFLQRNYFE